MLIVRDSIIKRRIVYQLFEQSNSDEILCKTVDISISLFNNPNSESRKPGLYYSNINLLDDSTDFYNNLFQSPPSTSRIILYALRILFSFLYINNYKIDDIQPFMVDELLMFLMGEDYISNSGICFSFSKKRSIKTVKDYCSIYNNYFKRAKINISYAVWSIDDINKKIDKQFNTSTPSTTEISFISPEQYDLLISNISPSKHSSEKIVIKLMYKYGLRMGEALGLTREDVVNTEDGFFLFLRNRSTDQLYQSAYGLRQYPYNSQISYESEKNIQWKIKIDFDMYTSIYSLIQSFEEYSAITNSSPAQFYAEKLNKQFPKTNRYLFFKFFDSSSRMVLLSDQHMKYFLDALFKNCNIKINSKNYSSIFRNSFAMNHTKFSSHPLTRTELQRELRVVKPSAINKYYIE